MIVKILLISLAVVQLSSAKPTTIDDDVCQVETIIEKRLPSENDKNLPASTQLFKFGLLGVVKLAKSYAHGGKAISEQLLQDEEILNSKSPKVLEFKQNLTRFEEKYAQCYEISALFHLADTYSNTTTIYYVDDETTLDNDEKLILALLRKYNSSDLDKEYLKNFDTLQDDVAKKFASLKEQYAKEDYARALMLSEYFGQYDARKADANKMPAIARYFEHHR